MIINDRNASKCKQSGHKKCSRYNNFSEGVSRILKCGVDRRHAGPPLVGRIKGLLVLELQVLAGVSDRSLELIALQLILYECDEVCNRQFILALERHWNRRAIHELIVGSSYVYRVFVSKESLVFFAVLL